MFDALQLIGGMIVSIGYIPQIAKIIRTKSAEDFNVATFLMIVSGVSCMEAYAIYLAVQGVGLTYCITNTVNLMIVLTQLILVFKYGQRRKKNGKIVFQIRNHGKQQNGSGLNDAI